MKNFTLLLFFIVDASAQSAFSQAEVLAPDQNPNYYTSKAKYMMIADSVNKFHSTTLQNTYEYYDWYDAKQKSRYDRISFKRQLRMERARNNYQWNNNGWYGDYNRYSSAAYNTALPFLLFNRWWR